MPETCPFITREPGEDREHRLTRKDLISRICVWDGVLELFLPHSWGRWLEHSFFVRETEGSLYTHGDPSVIRQDRADATSLNEAGEAQGNPVP
jgi:hypothetical protein